MKIFDYSLWPNIDGEIGEKKIPIPDGVTVQWPDGDSLVGYFVYKNEKLTAFVDTKAFITNESNSTIFPYENVIIRVDGSLKGVVDFRGSESTKNLIIRYTSDDYYIKTDVENGGNIEGGGNTGGDSGGNTGGDDNEGDDNETGGSGNTGGTDTETIVLGTKYINCTTVDEMMAIDANCPTVDIVDGIWSESLTNLTTCDYPSHEFSIFDDNADLREFHSDLSRLQNGYPMFRNDINLEKFDVPYLNSLTDGTYMFLNCASLDSFSCEMYNIRVGYCMFNGCSSLSTFNSSLSSLEHGDYMFSGCKSLYSFNEDCSPEYRNLSSLTNGYCMFYGCSSLPFFDSDLSSLTEGRNMFLDCSNLSTFNSNLQSLLYGYMMFSNCASLSSFDSNLDSLEDGYYMFLGCNSLDAFDVNMSSLKHGDYMFDRCSQLSSFDSNLDSLVYGDYMFRDCDALKSFDVDMPSLTNGHMMFYLCDALMSFDADLKNLTNGVEMFCACPNLSSFNSNLEKLTNGSGMFFHCTNLSSFNANLGSLTRASGMFSNTILDASSIENIATTINTVSNNPNLDIGINSSIVSNNAVINNLKTIKSKGWNLKVYVNGEIFDYENASNNLGTKYINCTTVDEMYVIDSTCPNNDIVDGIWNENLEKLTNCQSSYNYRSPFEEITDIITFNSDLSSLENGYGMFAAAVNLIEFNVPNLNSLTYAYRMFENCSNLQSFDCDMMSLTDGTQMFYGCEKLSSFISNIEALTNGYIMFKDCRNLSNVEADLKSLTNGHSMFYNCENLSSFTHDMNSLTHGQLMFYNCTSLSTFTSDMNALLHCDNMFYNCSSLTTVESDMKSLKDGTNLFYYCYNLAAFGGELSSLTNGSYMFSYNNLSTFNETLSSLTNGRGMFSDCFNLSSFASNLSSLTDGNYMFYGCVLDAASVKNIINTIKTLSSSQTGIIDLGIGCETSITDKNLFAREAGYNDMDSLLNAFTNKRWSARIICEGRPSSTYGLRNNSEETLPIFAKLDEVILPTEEEIQTAKDNGENITIPHYRYTSIDGTKFYNIIWFHETNGSREGYTQFDSLEAAIDAFGVK